MSRSPHTSPLARRSLPIAVVLLTVTAFLPPGVGAWPRWFGRLLEFFVAPVSQPVHGLAAYLAPAEERSKNDDAVRALEQQAESYRQQLMRMQLENEQLRQQITDLQQGIQLNSNLPVRQLHAAVIGSSSDLSSGLLWIKAGRSDGVEVNSVATARGLWLLGRVTSSDAKTCQVQPITSRAAGQLRGVVMLAETARGPECLLEPMGDGTLRGPVEDLREWPAGAAEPAGRTPGQPVQAQVGQTVRLADLSWPKSSQALIIGRIERVEPAADQPLRQIVWVRPTLRLERVSEVVLRISSADNSAGKDGAGGGGP